MRSKRKTTLFASCCEIEISLLCACVGMGPQRSVRVRLKLFQFCALLCIGGQKETFLSVTMLIPFTARGAYYILDLKKGRLFGTGHILDSVKTLKER